MLNPQVALSQIFFGSTIPFRSVPSVDPCFEHLMHRSSSSVKCGNSVDRTFLSQFKALKYLPVKGCFQCRLFFATVTMSFARVLVEFNV